jgi:hypothetical protein
MTCLERAGHEAGLRPGQRAAAGAESQHARRH